MRTVGGTRHRGLLGILISAVVLLNSSDSFAAALTETWSSARAQGMGNAYTAVVKGPDALFYNPAALARGGGFRWTLLDPRVGANGLSAYNAVKDFTTSEDVAQLFDDLYGQPIWVGGGGKSALQIGGLAVGAYSNADVSGYLQNPAYPVFDFKYAADYGFIGGLGFDVVPAVAMMGMAARRVTRVGTAAPLGVSTLATLNSDQLEESLKNRGTGYGLDLAFMLTLPTPVRPSVAVVWQNIGNTEFTKEAGLAAPMRIDQVVNFGASLEISIPFITITPCFDYKYVLDEDIQLGKKVHFGLEISLPLVDIRGGLNQGYYTLGAGVNLGLVRADVATYGVELGEYPGQMEDRRYMAQVTLELGFDPNSWFGSGEGGKDGKGGKGGGGGGRRLKHRR